MLLLVVPLVPLVLASSVAIAGARSECNVHAAVVVCQPVPHSSLTESIR